MKVETHPARRTETITPFIVMDVLDRAKDMEARGEKIIHFEVGEPDFDTPEAIKRAGIEAIEHGETKYTQSLGMIQLRRAISTHYKKTYGVSVDPERIMVGNGTSNVMLMVFGSLLNPGDEVILSNPRYSCYPNFITFSGGKPVDVDIYEKEGYRYSPERMKRKISSKTKVILINSPSNPTGVVQPPNLLKRIANLGPYVVSDEIYHGLSYIEKARSILEFSDRAFVLNGFSKLYAMTGWRLGYVIAPMEFVRPMQKLQQNFNISPNSFVQWAGIAALTKAGPAVRKMVRTFDRRRRLMVTELQKIGFRVAHVPEGAFYVFVNARHLDPDSRRLAFRILEEAKVAVTPGIDFGSNGEGHLRFSYATSVENIREGIRRLRRFFG
jgi:aspartate/methionine/tyrosine aminotransferase